MSRVFTPDEIRQLREQGIISKEEVVYQEGDLYVAKNVVTDSKRIVEIRSLISSRNESKRVLKG